MPKHIVKQEFGFSYRDPMAPEWLKFGYCALESQRRRCNNPRQPGFKSYGARGIKIEYGTIEFLRWVRKNFSAKMVKLRKRGVELHIGRIDHDKGYRLDNIEIVTARENGKELRKRQLDSHPPISVEKIDRTTGKITFYETAKIAAKSEGITPAGIYIRIKVGKGSCLYGSKIRTPSKFYFKKGD